MLPRPSWTEILPAILKLQGSAISSHYRFGICGKKTKKNELDENTDAIGGGEESSHFLPYFKPNYKRLYPENSTNLEYKVFVQTDNNDRLGNKSPIYLNHIFTTDIKGVVAIHRVNAIKIAVVFKQYNTANNFLMNTAFLDKYKMKAYIPAAQIEKTGIIRHVPANISNKELYCKLSSMYEIIAVRRFIKKVGHERVPLQTVSITFLANNLPDHVQYDLFSYRVFDNVTGKSSSLSELETVFSATLLGSYKKGIWCQVAENTHHKWEGRFTNLTTFTVKQQSEPMFSKEQFNA
ncbi:hypothetical protein evm_004624 [Chilo suppressalis]|nr:hypothetical protein evm_004624 [Chilo suppressalis]